ncbi:ACT domain-containing protein ACR11, partial [Camellia lanceoleosa]
GFLGFERVRETGKITNKNSQVAKSFFFNFLAFFIQCVVLQISKKAALVMDPHGPNSIVLCIMRSSSDGSYQETDTIPTPKVIIDQDTDPDATVVEITFGDRLGALLDTANVYLDSSVKHTKFAITKANTGRKVDDPELLEAIRLTIINNLLEYPPESSAQLAMGAAFGIEQPTEKVDVDIATRINVYDDGPDRSLLYVETADRPGLLVDIVTIITDLSIAVESGEFDTELSGT